MKIIFFIFSSMLILFGCTTKDKKLISLTATKKIVAVNSNYTFTFFYTTDSSRIAKPDSIIIQNKKNKLEIQKIYLIADDFSVPEFKLTISVNEDVNFDGYNDIGLLNYEGSYNNCYSYWVFDKKTNTFRRNFSLDSIYNPVFNKTKGEVCSKWHSGFNEFHLEKYFWDGDALKLNEKYEEFWYNNNGILIIKKLKNGKYENSETKISKRMIENMSCK